MSQPMLRRFPNMIKDNRVKLTTTTTTTPATTTTTKPEKHKTKTTKKKVPEEDIPGCICNRSLRRVLCPVCGYNIEGRVRKCCSWHPNVIHLMDLGACPKCTATCLREIDLDRRRRHRQQQQE